MKLNALHCPCSRPKLLAQHHPKAPKPSIIRSLIRYSPANGAIKSSTSTGLHRALLPLQSSATDAAPTSPASAPSNTAHSSPSSSPATNSLTFQEAITRLQLYWSSRGCAIWLPHNTEVGAGTMNPATFLRVLGPEPWNVAYVEPSIRPDDSRYGDNPNRLQRHTQFQVILKPDPGNSQELYLGSLEALGIDTRKHDVRFVEDNWESPVLGAWGLGWEVWLDGMEVTQFTYFQQAGGKPLHAPAVEITYGLERILMALQGVSNFKDIRYNEAVSYGELFLQNEYEMSVYNLDKADVAGQRQRFELFESEARRLLAERLPVPAYDHLLKLSHCFNVLDARGAVGVTERANCFATLRALSREVTSLWLSRREELGHPLGVISPPTPPSPQQPKQIADGTSAAPLVLEVGTEELPPEDLDAGLEQLSQRVPALLQKLRLSYSGVRVEGTPRRMAVIVEGLATQQTTQESEVRGPPTKAAFAADGSPTKALEGFCKKNGVAPGDVTKQADAKGVEYVFAKVKEVGRPAAEVLTEALPGLVSSLSFRKSMKWGAGDVTFSRPVRWLLALLGDIELPFVWGNLQAGRVTRLLRNSEQPEAQVPSADAYEGVLKAANICLEQGSRRSSIWAQVTAAAADMGGVVPETAGDDLLTEVTNLVESPTLVVGSFEPKFLNLPKEVLVMVMRKHQRYFPIVAAPGGPDAPLLPAFITVANGSVDQDVVAAGNAAVLRARFEDATFFYEEDLKQPLEAFRPKLAGTIFQKDLGTLLDKAQRMEGLVQPLAQIMGISDSQAVLTAQRAAHLAKADLATATVTEMTDLAGTMGRHYAQKQGLDAGVAEAIFEAALPRQAGDMLPTFHAGLIVSVAERLDALVGLFAAGCAPTAASDPYALRRSAYGMLQALVGSGVSFDLPAAVRSAAQLQPLQVTDQVQQQVLDYVGGRLEQLVQDAGVPPELVRGVLAERGHNPALAVATAQQLHSAWTSAEQGEALRSMIAALSRPTRIVRGKAVDPSWSVDPAKFEHPEEAALYDAMAAFNAKVQPSSATVAEFVDAAAPLVAPIDAYFEKVFVMAEDEGVRQNRLACLLALSSITRGWVDLSRLPGF
mmetsp:Transcript_3453/g.7887  ORF Transcript_3453/g.7887 Transcript_3453/m.7887 type:complete len:1097 (-) Transcript_3453:1061-4351(-)|eukprot:CAMPEP_0202384874 /NCGR_PEP_ID=MMETSP1127-20130417/57559_1 /ASSEMBLY_ACC=CAM_ASM_000462 /TAXON_ID=3047 /ORGANISM="Dunaliella tertiolecta, Strain CCMP1320" /LENGTH=1096 /DNA_ID=CAMNT_0048984837 /DNA_START=21 /DNA_END=3311 /DNA_ORIENTATION=+